jgi:diguanylate cyclase (GGDEF)-like protein
MWKPRLTVEGLSLAALVLAVVTIAALSAVALTASSKLNRTNELLLVMQRVISSLESIRLNAVYVDTGEQNFVITGDASTLAPFLEGGVEMQAEIAYLEDKRQLLKQLDLQYDDLRVSIDQLVDAQRKIIDARKQSGFNAAREMVQTGIDRVLQEKVTRLVSAMLFDARRSMDRLAEDQIQFADNVKTGTVALISSSGIVLLLLFFAVRKLNYDQRLARAKITHAATHDSLTGLPNRAAIIEQLDTRLADPDTERALGGFGLMLLDLDGFKAVNDTMGHDAGDELLKLVSARMMGALRETDFLARLGGDEFLILIPQISDRETAERIAEKLTTVVARPYTLPAGVANVTVSIGISQFPDDALDREALMKCADKAMYEAKHAGRNRAVFYSKP